jgi:hypothetical protein
VELGHVRVRKGFFRLEGRGTGVYIQQCLRRLEVDWGRSLGKDNYKERKSSMGGRHHRDALGRVELEA